MSLTLAETHGREPAAVAVGDIVHFESLARERLARPRPAACRSATLAASTRCSAGRARPLGRRQQAVARAHREPVGLAQRRAAHDARCRGRRRARGPRRARAAGSPSRRSRRARAARAAAASARRSARRRNARAARRPRAVRLELVLGHAIAIAVAVDLVRARQEDEVAAGSRAAARGPVRPCADSARGRRDR